MSEVAEFTPRHGGLQRPGAKRHLVRHFDLPPWHGWSRREAEHILVARWIEKYLVQPIGIGQGDPLRVAGFQRDILRRTCEALATFISIPAGNGKTTFETAVALERLMRGDEYVQVDILATKTDQALRIVNTAIKMIESSPELAKLADQGQLEFYKDGGILEYRPTGSRMTAHPAKLSAVQGLQSKLALIDEIGFVPAELVTALIARLGKDLDARVIGFGTPGFEPDNMLEVVRSMAHQDELPNGVAFIEYAAKAGCALDDRKQWHEANPAIQAGFLREDALEVQAALMLAAGREHEFRAYHLGQPIESSGPWLPYGAWEECVQADPPRDSTPVVLALWGNYRRQMAIVGSTLDGAIFFGWQAEKPGDAEVGEVIRRAAEQWEILELTHKPHIRLNLMAQLADEGIPVVSWPTRNATVDADSASALYQAITESQLAHDHHPVLAEQVARLVAKVDPRGNPRLLESEDVPAALAMRAAWWRARVLAGEDIADDDYWRIR